MEALTFWSEIFLSTSYAKDSARPIIEEQGDSGPGATVCAGNIALVELPDNIEYSRCGPPGFCTERVDVVLGVPR